MGSVSPPAARGYIDQHRFRNRRIVQFPEVFHCELETGLPLRPPCGDLEVVISPADMGVNLETTPSFAIVTSFMSIRCRPVITPAAPPTECGYCNSVDLTSLWRSRDTQGHAWSWGRCQTCAAISILPRPDIEHLAAAYASTYYGEHESKFTGLAEAFIDSCRRSRARRLAANLSPGARVLDLGCGCGGFLAALHAHGNYDLHGIELDGGSARRAAKHPEIHLKVGTLEAGDFPDASLDLVTLFHVFEHLTEPRATLELIHRALKPGGRVVMSFPNIASMQARMFRGHWLHLDPPRHLFLFPPTAFARVMATAGFAVERRRFFSIEQNPFGFIQSCLNAMGLPRDLLYERLKGNMAYASGHGSLSILLQKVFAGLCLGPAIALDACESALGLGATVEFTLRRSESRKKAPEKKTA